MENTFDTEEQIDAFADAVGFMLFEMAKLYKAGDPRFERVANIIEANITGLAAAAKAGVAKTDH